MKKFNGLTLLEVMVALAIIAILSSLAAPSFTQMIQSNTISSNVNTFLADMRFARSESIRRGGGVVMCRSDAPEAVNPACANGSGPDGNGWASGWIVFQDWNNDGAQDTNEPLLRVKSSDTVMDSITEADATTSTQFRFTATGRLSTSPTQLHFGGGNYASNVRRLVCVDLGGRAHTTSPGTVDCGSP
jgi:type IV fimbrial biogenesis protein FimT